MRASTCPYYWDLATWGGEEVEGCEGKCKVRVMLEVVREGVLCVTRYAYLCSYSCVKRIPAPISRLSDSLSARTDPPLPLILLNQANCYFCRDKKYNFGGPRIWLTQFHVLGLHTFPPAAEFCTALAVQSLHLIVPLLQLL